MARSRKLDTFWIVDVLVVVSVVMSPVKVSKLAGMVTFAEGVLLVTRRGRPKSWTPVPSVREMLYCNGAAKGGAGQDRCELNRAADGGIAGSADLDLHVLFDEQRASEPTLGKLLASPE